MELLTKQQRGLGLKKTSDSLARASTRVKLRVVRNFILLVSVKLWVNSFEAHCQS